MHNAPHVLGGVELFELIDKESVECLDKKSLVSYLSYDFAGGCPLNIRGEWNLTRLPPGFHYSIFEFQGLFAALPIGVLLERLVPGEIQRFPIGVMGDRNRYEMLNLTKAIDCLDSKRSDICFHPLQRGVPIGLRHIVLKPQLIKGAHIFRLENHRPTVIVSDYLRNQLQSDLDLSGVVFEEVGVGG